MLPPPSPTSRQADWCGPCKMIAPKIETLAQTMAKEDKPITFHKVDVDDVRALAQRLGISAMPTFHAYKGKELVGEVVGAVYPKVQELVAKALE